MRGPATGAWGAGGARDPPAAPCACRAAARRAQEVHVRHVQPVRQDHRRGGAQDAQVERAGLGRLHRHSGCHQRAAHHAVVPLLREAHRERALAGMHGWRGGEGCRSGRCARRCARRTCASCARGLMLPGHTPAEDPVRQGRVGRRGQAQRHLQTEEEEGRGRQVRCGG